MGRLSAILKEEVGGFHCRLAIAQQLVSLLPDCTLARLRTWLYRLGGVNIGRGTTIFGKQRITGGCSGSLLRIGKNCFLNGGTCFNLGEQIILEDNVYVGMDCLLITCSHELGPAEQRAGAVTTGRIQIGRGAWIAARVTLLPGVSVGSGCIVGAGSVVTKDIPCNVLAAGVPARVIHSLDGPSPEDIQHR